MFIQKARNSKLGEFNKGSFLCFVFVSKENRLKKKLEKEFAMAEAGHGLCPYLLTTLLLW